MHYEEFFDKYLTKAILIIAFLAPLAVFSYFFYANQGYWWDEAVYLGLAKNLYDGNGYYINANQESFRPPLFPFMISLLWKIFGQTEFVVRIIPPVFGIISIAITYVLAKRLHGKEAAVWAVLMLATMHMFLFYGLKMLTETIFMTFFGLSLYLYYAGVEKDRRLLPFAGIAMALTFLTKYMGYVLPVMYAIYPLTKFLKSREDFKRIFFDKHYWAGALLFAAVLAPWAWMSYVNFGSPFGALLVESSTVTTGWYIEGWDYYFAHWIEIFGLVGFFAVPAALYAIFKIKKSENAFAILVMASILVFFMILPRKEMRYMISFLPFFATLFAIGAVEMKKWLKWNLSVDLFVIAFCIINFIAGIQMIQYDMQGGYALKQAGLFLKSVAPAEAKIMSQNMPVLFYTAGKDIIYFPENENDLNKTIIENKIFYMVIEKREPTYPQYVWTANNSDKTPSPLFSGYKLEKTFQENGITYVWVYRI